PSGQRARASGLRIDGAAAPVRALASGAPKGGGVSGMRIDVVDLTVSLRDSLLVSGWHGTPPPLDPEGPEGWLRRPDAGIDLQLRRSFDVGFAGGDLEVAVDPATSL